MELESKIKLVVAKKEAIFAHVTDLYNSSKKLVTSDSTNTRSKQDFLAATANIDKLYTTFNTLCDQYNALLLEEDPDYKLNFSNWSAFETLHSSIQHTRESLLTRCTSLSADRYRSDDEFKYKCRLPPLELRGFSGDVGTWPLFYQSFKTNVHDNRQLNDNMRIQYLISKLSGTALNTFAGIVPNEQNYKIIWDSLVSRYQDKRLLGTTYLNEILESKPAADSAVQLNNFVERVHSSWAALKQLDISDLSDFIFTHIALKKIDSKVVQSFELSIRDKEIPTSTDLVDFVRHHIKILERTNTSNNNIKQTYPTRNNNISQSRSQNSVQPKVSHTFAVLEDNDVNKRSCIFCKTSSHSHLYECTAFKKMAVNERFAFIKENRLCINCFSASHNTMKCGSRNSCKMCSKRHHSLLCKNMAQPAMSSNKIGTPDCTRTSADNSLEATSQSVCMYSCNGNNNSVSVPGIPEMHEASKMTEPARTVHSLALHSYDKDTFTRKHLDKTIVLPTAEVFVYIERKRHILRCLIDSASQNNIITQECCDKLKLNIQPLVNSSLKSVGSSSTPIKGYVTMTIQSRVSDAHYGLKLLVVDKITDNLPTRVISTSMLHHLQNIPLADEHWSSPGSIDAILGTQIFALILLGSKIEPHHANDSHSDISDLTKSGLYALQTSLGYIVTGEIVNNPEYMSWSFGPLVNELDRSIEKFWELEEVPSVNSTSPENHECEQLYKSTVTRSSCGRYIVSLPFKSDPNQLGNSYTSALRRLAALERKFIVLPALRQAYNDVITDYMKKGYLTEIPYTPAATASGYFIPHHAVVRPDKSTTKTRIVLDASAKTDNGLSLNDLLHTGPNLQADLFTLLLKFRFFKIAITADVQQMYLRILLNEKDRKYQKILYRFSDAEPLRILQFNSVAFGLRSSPFLAMRTVRQLAEDERERFPYAGEIASRELYMDDLTTSVQTVEDGSRIADELLALFDAGGFKLVKWATNSPELLAHLPESHRAAIEFTDDNDTLKVLGLKWIPTADAFSFTTSTMTVVNTKRAILSTIARLFDVLGFVAPVTLYAKILMQELWTAKTGWDEVPPSDLVDRFIKFKEELPLLTALKIPRHLGIVAGCTVNLVAFGDASIKAFGCVIYLHVVHPNNDISVHLVCSKSKVAPLKTVSLARLELCAALLLAKLAKQIHTTLSDRYPIQDIFAFSDSTVALSWIHASPHRWQTFVANRVTKIQEMLSPDRFFHIEGVSNPSDVVSRGVLPSQLVNHPLWWRGPSWMSNHIAEWPVVPFDPSRTEGMIPETKPSVTLTTISHIENPLLLELALRVSSWKKLIRIVVYVLRFARKLPLTTEMQVSDLETAELKLMKDLQSKYFSDEMRNIKKGNLPSPALRKLDPFIDNAGLLRVGGRLTNANIPYENRHPILLPRRDHLVDLIIDDCHRSNCHTGSHLVMSLLRQRYWIISARNIIRQRIRKCNFCFKVAPTHPTPMMASLIPARVQEAKPFAHTGVDYAGPISITLTRRRGTRSQKAYIVLFSCLTTRSTHLEIASDLSTETFLDAFKRFLARRGPVSSMYSDNAGNFICAKRQLDELHTFLAAQTTSTALRNELTNRRIDWRTIPARAPHWAGAWEANIKCVKSHLYRTIGRQLLCYEELLTVLTQIECILNSRPLCLLSDQPHTILTPAHFLNTTPLQSLPALEVDTSKTIYNRKKLLDSLVQSYWKRWHVDYLHTLQVRQKWNTPDVQVQPGTLVLIHQDNTPPLRWPTGIIEQVYPGKDGVTRAALVRTVSGTFKRPVVKLCPLPSQ